MPIGMTTDQDDGNVQAMRPRAETTIPSPPASKPQKSTTTTATTPPTASTPADPKALSFFAKTRPSDARLDEAHNTSNPYIVHSPPSNSYSMAGTSVSTSYEICQQANKERVR